MKVIINNLNNVNFKKVLKKMVLQIAKREKIKASEVSITFVTLKKIQQLNKKYLKKNAPTDVLSFPMIDEKKLLGDIIISTKIARKQAKLIGHSFIDEVKFLTAHGMYHLLGYDHYTAKAKKIMRAKEKRAVGL